MATITLNLDARASALIENWVRAGHYASPEEVVEAGIHFVREQVEAGDWPLSPADIAAIQEGLDDVDAGRVIDLATVREEMRARFTRKS